MTAVAALALLAGCDGPLDYDLRGNLGGFSTTDAAKSANTASRPQPDARGVITYPNYQVAVARRGDRVGDVAARVGLPVAELARFNGLNADDVLRDGEVIALPREVSPGSGVDIESLASDAIASAPSSGSVQTTTLAPATSTTTPAPAPAPAGPEPVRHKVARGETAYTISRLYQVPVEALAEWNGLGPDFAVREGQFLLIPIKNQPVPAAATATASTAAVTQPGQGSPTPTPPSATQPLPDEKIAAVPPKAPDVTAEAPTKTASSTLALPVSGKIVRPYRKGKNEGIDIAGSAGASVVAAEAGTVAAITADADQVPIIVIRHPDELLTVYANVDNITVQKGDRVKRGQKIAVLRGGDDAYVHFEVRKGFDSVDPDPYLK